ncbi:unnamed protein product [Cladocopium goreaui]|uniref:Uncharacterized protein n=1 Tax=Cladocopium goreaui TaxID=2562237 RepID=A0A9P1FG42_9DINO|nr:unnamed protein product [Cladocopium goreaui]
MAARQDYVPRELLEASAAIASLGRRVLWREGLEMLDAALVHRAVQPDQVARSAAMAGVSRGAEWSYAPLLLSFLWRDLVEVHH